VTFRELKNATMMHVYELDDPDFWVNPYEVDYQYLFDTWSQLPNHEKSIENECTKHMEFINGLNCKTEIPMNLMFVTQCEAYLSAFANLSLPKRLKYITILLYCSQPNHTITFDNINKNALDFLYAAQLIDIKEDTGIPITTKEGMYFLYRFLISKDLKAEFI
jgi:hypothetical protein